MLYMHVPLLENPPLQILTSLCFKFHISSMFKLRDVLFMQIISKRLILDKAY